MVQLKEAIPELKEIVYIANSSFKGAKEMNALSHVTSSSLNEKKIRKIAEKNPGMLKDNVSMNRRKGSSLRIESMAERSASEELREEDMAIDASTANLQEVFKYTKTHLLRVYPAGWRIDRYSFIDWYMPGSLIITHLLTYLFSPHLTKWELRPDYCVGLGSLIGCYQLAGLG